MRLNYKKWRAAMDSAKSAEQITTLLSIRAHITGKVHRNRARLPYYTLFALGKVDGDTGSAIAQMGGSAIYDLNAEDQAKLFAKLVDQYVLTAEEEAEIVKKEKSLLETFRDKLRGIF